MTRGEEDSFDFWIVHWKQRYIDDRIFESARTRTKDFNLSYENVSMYFDFSDGVVRVEMRVWPTSWRRTVIDGIILEVRVWKSVGWGRRGMDEL